MAYIKTVMIVFISKLWHNKMGI